VTNETVEGATVEATLSRARRMADAATVDAVRQGDHSAYASLVERWVDDVNDHISRAGVPDEHAPEVLEIIFELARDRLDERTEASFGAAVMGTALTEIGTPPVRTRGDLTPSRRTAGKLSRGTDAAVLARDPIIVKMVWDSAHVLGDRVSEIMDLHWRHGLDPGEIATIAGIERRRVEKIIAMAPQGLASALRTRLLWAGGTPEHDELADKIRQAGLDTFDSEAVRLVHRHIRDCAVCRSRSMIALSAIEVFAAVPLERATLERRSAVLAALGFSQVRAEPAGVETEQDSDDGDDAAAPGTADEGATDDDRQRSPASGADSPGQSSPLDDRPPMIDDDAPTVVLAAPDLPATFGSFGAFEGSEPDHLGAGASDDEPGRPAPQPVAGRPGGKAARRWRRPLVVIGVVVVVVVVLAAVALARGGSDGGPTELDVASTPQAPTERTTPTTAPATTTPPAEEPPVEELPEPEPETDTTLAFPDLGPADPPAAPVVPPLDAPTAPPTTQPLGLQVTFDILSPLGGGRVVRNYTMGDVRLRWSAGASRPISVEITGPINGPTSSLRTTLSDQVDLCPGPRSGTTCIADIGAYYYTIKVFDGGVYVYETTAVLCIALADQPSCF
jgi:hypothetical protein